MRFRVLSFVGLLLLPVAVSAQSKDPVAGAWEQLSSKNVTTGESQQLQTPPLHLIYSNGHYVQFTAAAKRAKGNTPREQMTKEQLVERYNLQGQYGTYQVAGNKLTRKIISAASPDNEGRESTSDFRIEGDQLIVTSKNAQGQTAEARYRRLK
jgi:anti-sigma28 factor (negative regulator of flagellin synthesis)